MLLLFVAGLKGGYTYPSSITQMWKLGLREGNWVPGVAQQGKFRIFPSGLSLNGQQAEGLTGASRLRPGG